MHYAPQKNDVYVYFRYTDKQKIMVLLNKSLNSVVLDVNRYSQMIPTTFKAKDVINNQVLSIESTLTVPAKTAMILEIQ
jgi:neopullulanase